MSKTIIIPGKGRVNVNDNPLGAICIGSEPKERPVSLYEREKARVYATGNKWAIENFHATHD